MQKDLWRIEDVLAGLSTNKENFRILVDSVKNPGQGHGPQMVARVLVMGMGGGSRIQKVIGAS